MEVNREHIERRFKVGLMIPANVITEISKREGIGWHIVEKDYFLTLVLEGLANNTELIGNLIFKGGTALRKAYFRHYRYSEDLDFTLKDPIPEKEMESLLLAVFGYLKKEHNAGFNIKSIYSKKWFTDIKIQFLGLKGQKNTITIDLNSDEVIADTFKKEKIYNPYYEKHFSLPVYSMNEI